MAKINPYKRRSYIPLIHYIKRKRVITDPVHEAELMNRYRRRYGTLQPPKFIPPMSYDLLKKRKRLSTDEIDAIRKELGLTWTNLADACKITTASMSYHKKKPEISEKYQEIIRQLFLKEIKKQENKEEKKIVPPSPSPSPSSKNNHKQEDILDDEIATMKLIHEHLIKLDKSAQNRVVNWVSSKFDSQESP